MARSGRMDRVSVRVAQTAGGGRSVTVTMAKRDWRVAVGFWGDLNSHTGDGAQLV